MNSQDIYRTALGAAAGETGTDTYDRMQKDYAESLEGSLKTVQAKIEEVFLNLFESSSFTGAVRALGGLVDVLNNLIEATGGGSTALLGLSAILMNMASNSLARGVGNFVTNRQQDKLAGENIQEARDFARLQLRGKGLRTNDARLQEFAQDTAGINQYAHLMNDEQLRQSNQLIQDRIQVTNQLSAAEEREEEAANALRTAIAQQNIELGNNVNISRMSTEELAAHAESLMRDYAGAEKMSQLINPLGGEIQSLAKEYAQLIDLINSGNVATTDTQAAVQNFAKSLEAVKQKGGLAAETIERMDEAYAELAPILEKGAAEIKETRISTEQTSTVFRELAQALELDSEKIEDYIINLVRARRETVELGESVRQAAGFQQAMQHGLEIQDATNKIVGLITGIGQLAFAWQSFQHLGALWTDENTELGEKLLETIINVSFAVPMLAAGVRDIAAG